MKRRKVTPEKLARIRRQHLLLCPAPDDLELPCDLLVGIDLAIGPDRGHVVRVRR